MDSPTVGEPLNFEICETVCKWKFDFQYKEMFYDPNFTMSPDRLLFFFLLLTWGRDGYMYHVSEQANPALPLARIGTSLYMVGTWTTTALVRLKTAPTEIEVLKFYINKKGGLPFTVYSLSRSMSFGINTPLY